MSFHKLIFSFRLGKLRHFERGAFFVYRSSLIFTVHHNCSNLSKVS